MSSFASNLFHALFTKKSARPAAVRRRAALGFEPLEMRAVFSTGTGLPQIPVRDLELNVSSPILSAHTVQTTDPGLARKLTTDANWDRAGTSAQGGQGAGKVSMRDFSFNRPVDANIRHAGGVNVALGDGSVRNIKDSVSTGVWATDAANDRTSRAPTSAGGNSGQDGSLLRQSELERAGSHGGGGGAGKVAMQDIHFTRSAGAASRHTGGLNVLLGDGSVRFSTDGVIVGASGGHVKVFDGTRSAESLRFFAYGGFTGGVRVAVADIGGDTSTDDNGHGTHVAGTIGAIGGTAGSALPGPHVKAFDLR